MGPGLGDHGIVLSCQGQCMLMSYVKKKKRILHNHRIFYIKVHFGYNILKFKIV